MIFVLALFFGRGGENFGRSESIFFLWSFYHIGNETFHGLFLSFSFGMASKAKVQRNIIQYVILTFGNWVTISLFLGVFWDCSDVSLACGHETLTVLPISHCFLTYVEDCKESISISDISIRSRHWCIFSTLASIGKPLLIPDYFIDIMKFIK